MEKGGDPQTAAPFLLPYRSTHSVERLEGVCRPIARDAVARCLRASGRIGSGGPEGPTTATRYQAPSEAGSTLKPGPIVEDRLMRFT